VLYGDITTGTNTDSNDSYLSLIKSFCNQHNITELSDKNKLKEYIKNNLYVKSLIDDKNNKLDNFDEFLQTKINDEQTYLEYFIDEYIEKKTKEIQSEFYNKLSDLIYKHINVDNKVINIPVNHLGDYSI
jgi:hypothetical protein